jgi:hypothetical protein
MAGTTGLEPATSDVTGIRSQEQNVGKLLGFNALNDELAAVLWAATVGATVPSFTESEFRALRQQIPMRWGEHRMGLGGLATLRTAKEACPVN